MDLETMQILAKRVSSRHSEKARIREVAEGPSIGRKPRARQAISIRVWAACHPSASKYFRVPSESLSAKTPYSEFTPPITAVCVFDHCCSLRHAFSQRVDLFGVQDLI